MGYLSVEQKWTKNILVSSVLKYDSHEGILCKFIKLDSKYKYGHQILKLLEFWDYLKGEYNLYESLQTNTSYKIGH